jgi:hypothetical protein
VAHAPNADHGDAVFPGNLYRVLHAHFGSDLTSGIIGMQNAAAGTCFFKGKVGLTVSSAFCNTFRIIFNADRAVRMNASCIGINQHIGNNIRVIMSKPCFVQLIGNKLMKCFPTDFHLSSF